MKKELSLSFVLPLQEYLKLTPASADLIGSKFEYLKFALQGTCPYKVLALTRCITVMPQSFWSYLLYKINPTKICPTHNLLPIFVVAITMYVTNTIL